MKTTVRHAPGALIPVSIFFLIIALSRICDSPVSIKEINITTSILSPAKVNKHHNNPIRNFVSPPPMRPNFQTCNMKMLPIQSKELPGKPTMKPVSINGKDI